MLHEAYAIWVGLGRPIRKPVILEEIRSKINSATPNAINRMDPRPPVISTGVLEHPHTGTQNTPSNAYGSGSNLPTFSRVQASEHGSARSETSVKSAMTSIAEVKKSSAAQKPRTQKPDNGESLLDWEWDADEGCFHQRRMHTHRSDRFVTRFCVRN